MREGGRREGGRDHAIHSSNTAVTAQCHLHIRVTHPGLIRVSHGTSGGPIGKIRKINKEFTVYIPRSHSAYTRHTQGIHGKDPQTPLTSVHTPRTLGGGSKRQQLHRIMMSSYIVASMVSGGQCVWSVTMMVIVDVHTSLWIHVVRSEGRDTLGRHGYAMGTPGLHCAAAHARRPGSPLMMY